MFLRVDNRLTRYIAFVVLMLSINIFDGMVTRAIADPGRRLIVSSAATFDVVAVVSGLYYWLLVRPGIRAPGSMVAIALLGVLHATCFYPNGLAIRAVVAGLCEAGLIGFVVVQVRRTTRRKRGGNGGTDPLDAIGSALASISVVPVVANFIAAELGVLYYGLFSWGAKPHVAAGTQAFSIHERAGQADLFKVVPVACALEILPVHLLLRHWSPALAWIGTSLSLYGAIWLIGLARAFRLRPVLVGEDYLQLRYGLLFELRAPKEMIACVRPADSGDKAFAVPRSSEPAVCIEFAQPIEAQGPFGIRKRVRAVAFTPDDETAFARALDGLTRTE